MGAPATFLGRTPIELRAVFSKLRSLIASGVEELEIISQLGISYEEYEELLRRFIEHELQAERKRSTDEHYLNYLLEQRSNLRELTGMIKGFGESKQFNAQVGAIRAKADILERVLDRAEQFGFINLKRPVTTINGILIANASSPEIRKTIQGMLVEMKQIAASGDKAMAEVEVGDLHQDEVIDVPAIAAPAPPPAKTSRAKPKKATRRVDPDALDQEPPL